MKLSNQSEKGVPLPIRKWPTWSERCWPGGDWKSKPSLFGLSTGRTGTTTLEYALNLSPKIAAFHEPLPRNIETYVGAYQNVYSNPDSVATYFARHRQRAVRAIQRRGQIYAETNNFQFASPVVAKLLPKSIFLFFHRHPGEYVRSGMRRNWYNGHNWDSYRLYPRPNDPWADRWQNWGPFEKICWFWQAANQLFIETIESLPDSRRFEVSFDSLILTRGSALLPVFNLLGVEAPSEEEVATIYSKPHNEQQQGEFADYEEWTDQQRSTLWEIAGKVMIRLGYHS